MWLMCGTVSVVFCVLGLLLAARKNAKAVYAVICSVAFVALTLLMEYRMVLNWVNTEDWGALIDVVPSAFFMLSGYVILMLLANSVSIWITRKN